MNISIPKETASDERRVALVPDVVAKLVKAGFQVRVEAGAGQSTHFFDDDYKKAGAEIIADAESIWSQADILAKIGLPTPEEIDLLRQSAVYVGFLNPLGDPSLIQRLSQRKVTTFSMELIPRISRAQSMDALSSQANIGGYKAVLVAAEMLGKFFPMLTTAAGTIAPAKLLVIGVGVAGLQAIATARRLGAVVEAYDIRPEVKEQVQSLGAKFVEAEVSEEGAGEGGYAKEVTEETKKKLQEALAKHVSLSDVVITTAQVPGKKAPLLVTEEMVSRMKSGAVVVDMAAEQGGNVALSKAGEVVEHNGVTILGPVNLPSTMPMHASQLYSKNISMLIQLLTKDAQLNLNFEDEIINGACVCHNGEIRNERVKEALSG